MEVSSALKDDVETPRIPPTYISPLFWAETMVHDAMANSAQQRSFFHHETG